MGTTIKRADIIFAPYSEYPYKVMSETIKKDPDTIINELIKSGLRGRGGAGFPTGLKWKFAKETIGKEKYVVSNADEGEPGTFKDREILKRVPRKMLSGMGICAHVIGAKRGFIYLRAEYEYLKEDLQKEINKFHAHCDKFGIDFRVEIKMGAGAYIVGEETALLNSAEGKRGEPRNKPPFPITKGFKGYPTVVNNVETFVNAMMVCKIGADKFAEYGMKGQKGSKLFSIAGDTPKPGVYELELGLTVEDLVNEFGDGNTKAVQVGGVSGFCIPRAKFKEKTIGFTGKLEGDSLPTGGSIMIFNSTRSMYRVLENYLEFFEEESCGQCTPCRVGTQQLLKGIKAIKKGEKDPVYLKELYKLAGTMKITSKCGLGQSVANSFCSIVDEFKEEIIY